jgi:hypothetical protein
MQDFRFSLPQKLAIAVGEKTDIKKILLLKNGCSKEFNKKDHYAPNTFNKIANQKALAGGIGSQKKWL